MPARWRCVLTLLALAGAPATAHAQLFLASRPHPEFAIGPLFVQATVTPELGPVTVDVLWSLVVPPTRSPADLEQDLYLLWPGPVGGEPGGRADPELVRYVRERGATVLEEGRLPLFSQSLYRMTDEAPPEPVRGGAPFVTFVRQGGALGLTSPGTYIRIPWTPRLVNRAWLMDLRLRALGLIKPKPGTWVEHTFWGPRYRIALGYNDVRQRVLFPLYFDRRDHVVRLADDPAQVLINFADADHLKIDDLAPQSSRRQLSETLESTETVSLFLDRSEGISPQVLTVQFGYFSGLQSWAPVLIPTLFFVLGNLAGPLLTTLAKRVGRNVAARVQVGRRTEARPGRDSGVVLSRETLARIVTGETTYAEVLRLCGPNAEEHEQLAAPDRRRLVYRGRRVVPQRRRTFGWFATVSHWEAEDHEVEIELERDVVRDVQARVRRTRLARPGGA